jgi:hypothetical protein
MAEGFRNEAADFAEIGRLHGCYLTMVACLEQRVADKAVREILSSRLDLLLEESQVKIIERVRRASIWRQSAAHSRRHAPGLSSVSQKPVFRDFGRGAADAGDLDITVEINFLDVVHEH